MTLEAKQFNEVLNFSRGTGATRINAAGLIVGVDFSSTSNTITTGSKTFTLTADANVNRDWSVGSSVIAVSQAGATGSMTGTVTSYTPSTQELVINVTSVTGSGTSTNWRIGSLEVRRDSNGVLVEEQRSNEFLYSDDIANAYWTKTGVAAATDTQVGRNGSKVQKVALTASLTNAEASILRTFTLTSGVTTTWSAVLKTDGSVQWVQFYMQPNTGTGWAFFDLINGVVGNKDSVVDSSITSVGNGFFKITVTFTATQSAINAQTIRFSNSNGNAVLATFTGVAGNGIYVSEMQRETGIPTSYIPTTTVGVTRAADSITATATTLAALRQGEGTLVVTAQNPDNGIAQKRALRLTGANGEIRIGKQGTGTTANFTKMVEGAGMRLMGVNSTGANPVLNNGLESIPLNASASYVDTRTGTAGAITLGSAIAFDGLRFGVVGTFTTSEEVVTIDTATKIFDSKSLGNLNLNGCHYTGSRFIIAVGNSGVVGISVDGTSYRRINAPVITQPTTEVTSGLVGGTNRVVIVGGPGFIATSDDDGETWTARTSGTTNSLNGVTRGATNFVAVGTSGRVVYSSDGINYSTLAVAGANNWIDVASNGSELFVAVGVGGDIYVSTNGGVSWTASASSRTVTTQQLNGVTYSPTLNLWIAVGAGGTIITATDPSGTWTAQTSGTAQNLVEVGIFNNAIYIVGVSSTLLTSTNGTTYTSLAAGATTNFNGIAASPTTLLITGLSGGMASSTDGTTFTSRTNNNQTLNGIAFGANRFVSVGNAANGSGYIATIDADGTVTRRVSGTTQNITTVKFVNGAFVSGGVSIYAYSTNGGVSWQSVIVPSGTTEFTFDGTYYITGRTNGTGNIYYFSTLGDPVILVTGFVANNYTSFETANGVVVMVGGGGTIYTKPVGAIPTLANWTLRTSGTTQSLNSVMYSTRDSRWYVAGAAGTLLFSEDNGVTWQSVQNAGLGAITNSGSQVNALLGQWQTGTNKIAISYKANEVITSLNGVSLTDTTATVPTVDSLIVGDTFNGYITSFKFFPSAVTAVELNAMTST